MEISEEEATAWMTALHNDRFKTVVQQRDAFKSIHDSFDPHMQEAEQHMGSLGRKLNEERRAAFAAHSKLLGLLSILKDNQYYAEASGSPRANNQEEERNIAKRTHGSPVTGFLLRDSNYLTGA